MNKPRLPRSKGWLSPGQLNNVLLLSRGYSLKEIAELTGHNSYGVVAQSLKRARLRTKSRSNCQLVAETIRRQYECLNTDGVPERAASD